ncbi:translocation/assembly module TamB domain-containing protein [Rugamonas sp. CCM 8940]|uniref:translocation/assembly module TamB domain-containing protein n=1 Tax=Rugamonas sp. CCM 8940 TaxID=2765359 RepID=UPI0018F3B0CD|nr:translocation/assembly module TamB domain-containing protein [Rugamonas sp. CCM 8940]MBJ7308969.1 translocation/assembly module TamB domain-containing protein [Rugamonas sp. CCM 8940]
MSVTTPPAGTAPATSPPPTPPTPPSAPAPRRWLRRLLIALAALVLLLAGAVWLLGREATLQQLVQRLSNASGGQISVSGVSGSLYHRMHIGHLVYRSPDSVITADGIDINWSPLQYFSAGLAISELHVASLRVDSIGPSKPTPMPTTLAPPFRLSVGDARLGRLTLAGKTGSDEIRDLRFKLAGDKDGWHLEDAAASTAFGQLRADLSIAGQRPFALSGKASLAYRPAPPATPTAATTSGATAAALGAPAAAAASAPAPSRAATHGAAANATNAATSTPALPAATVALTAGGNLELLKLSAKGAAGKATLDATLTLAPFDPIILRKADIQGRHIDPASFDASMPPADLSLQLQANISAQQAIGGQLTLRNEGKAGPLDLHLLPLQALQARLGGTLTATSIDAVSIDLGGAGQFKGAGHIARAAPDAGIAKADFALRTERLNLQGLHGSLHHSAIAGDIKLASDAKRQTLTATLADAGLHLDLNLRASLADALLQIEHARLQAKKGSVTLSGQASLKNAQAFKVSANALHFDPAAFGNYPFADLNAELRASGKLAPHWQLAADFALQPSKLLGQPLSGKGKLNADPRHLSGVEAKLALGQNTLQLDGSFGAPGEQLRWKVDARQLSAASSDLLGALSASGIVSGSMAAPHSSFEADAKGLGLASAKHPVPDSLLHASGSVQLSGAQRQPELTLTGSALRFNPAAFGAYPSGSVNADISGSAGLAGGWHAGLNLSLNNATLAGAPLSGYAKLTAAAGRVERSDINLRLGPNSLLASGAFGAPRDRLDWKLDAPQLNSLGPQFGGVLHAAGTLAGGSAQPALSLTLDGSALRLPGQQQLKSLRGSASLGAGDALVSDIVLNGYAGPALSLNQARLQTSGSVGAHVIQLSAANADFDAALRLKGGWKGEIWSGAIDTLQNRGRFALTLQAPAPLRLAAPAGGGVAGLLRPEQIALGATTITLPAGSLRLDYLEKNGVQWRSKGQAGGVPVNYLAQLSDAWRSNVKSDMTLGAAWALTLQAPKGGAPAVEGMLHAYREKGDITVLGADLPLPLGLRQLEARADVAGNTLRMQLNLDGSRAGQSRIDASVQMVDGRIADSSTLTLNGTANMASLAWLAPLTGQPGLELDGALKLAITGGGTIAAPQLNGDISGDKLVLNWAEQGIKLRNGQLQAKLAGDQLQLQKLSFDGAEGRAQADGWVRFANAEASMALKLTADKLELLARPDRILVVSGSSTLTRDAKRFQLDGKFRADRAHIELASQDTPTMSDDVVIVGRGGNTAAGAKAAQGPPLNIDVEADLGDNFNLKGKGLEAQLAGAVRIRIADRRPPRASGSIRVVSGTYAAYGQKLSIERGVINFTGAYDNPGLNILAVRKRPEGDALSETNVEAGVEVRGTALAPVAKLVSTPTVPDSDKLAWLVLGHGIENTAGNDMALLSTAAGALFGGGQGKLANSLGVDELGVTQAKGLESTVVTVGKRISSRAYLSFEQGAGSATSLVKLRYKLNPRITLQFQTGTNNALDVLYTWAFD